MSQGWICIHRQLKDHWIYNAKPYDKFHAWTDLLLSANHKDATISIGNTLVDIEKGSFITSEVKLAEKWGWTRKTVRSFLHMLESDNMLSKKSTTKYTSVTITNWALYQIEEQQKVQQKNIKGTSKGHQKHTNNNDNHDNNVNKKDINVFFEKLWLMYKRKEGKGSVSESKKKELFELGEEAERAVQRYNKKLDIEKTDKRYIKMGSTFFTSGYIDYLDANYVETVIEPEYRNPYRKAD